MTHRKPDTIQRAVPIAVSAPPSAMPAIERRHWAALVGDEPKEAGNRISKEDVNEMLMNEGWEQDVNTAFTFVDGKFQVKKYENKI